MYFIVNCGGENDDGSLILGSRIKFSTHCNVRLGDAVSN